MMRFRFAIRIFLLLGLVCLFHDFNSYSGEGDAIKTGKLDAGAFIRSWYILGPFQYSTADPDEGCEEHIEEALKNDYLGEDHSHIPGIIDDNKAFSIHETELKWKYYEAETDYIDLKKLYGDHIHSVAYIYAEISSDSEASMALSVGSNDGIMVFLNQSCVYEYFGERIALKDDIIVPVKLNKGINSIYIRLQSCQSEWGFYLRFLDMDNISERLRKAAYQGNLDDIENLVKCGAEINSRDITGLTALHKAMIAGRREAVELLKELGADENIAMPEKEAVVDAFYNNVFGEDTPGASILLSKDGEILYMKAFGNADIGNKVPFTTNTKSRVGSVTKQFVSSAILKLIEEGKLSLDDMLSEFIMDFPRGDEVSIHHLLTHTSGIQSYTGKQDFIDRVLYEVEPKDLLEYFVNDEYNFNPGEKWLYNNSGYFLLGYIIELVSEKSLDEYLKDTFFYPLGIHYTGIHNATDILENEAYGYSYRSDSFKKAFNWNMSWAAGAGALYSTVYDMYLWNEAVFNYRVLDQSTLEKAWTPVKLNDGSPIDSPFQYGYGWALTEARGLDLVSHGGGLHGFLAELRRYTDINATVAVMQNCSPPASDMSATELADMIAEIYLWEYMQPQESYRAVKQKGFDKYDDFTGWYDLGGSILKIRREGNRMFARLGIQDEYEIFPRSENEFFWKVVDAQISFDYDEDGVVSKGILTQSGMTFSVDRIIDNVPADIDYIVYDEYTGNYDLSLIKVTITRENNGLYMQAEGQAKIELIPRSETEFFSDAVVIRVEFSKDPSAGRMKICIHQMGVKLEGYKTEN